MRRQKLEGHAERIVGKPEIIPVVGAKTAITVTILSTGWGVSHSPMEGCDGISTIETGSPRRRQSEQRY
jgi:hypothetical protein